MSLKISLLKNFLSVLNLDLSETNPFSINNVVKPWIQHLQAYIFSFPNAFQILAGLYFSNDGSLVGGKSM